MGNLPNSLDNEILELCKQGKKLSAIKLLCETTGMGLKESKDYVDRLALKHGAASVEDKEGCFVATACYGDYNSLEVLLLRNYRDEKLLTTFIGSIFVKLYYTFSPYIAQQLDKSDKLKQFVRVYFLKPIVHNIEQNNFKQKV
jgi:hypothetical protein